MRKIIALSILGLMAMTAQVNSQTIVNNGAAISLGTVYWIKSRNEGCASLLKRVLNVQSISAPQGLKLSLQQPLKVKTNQCGNEVTGARINATAKGVASGTHSIQYVVTYDTENGNTTSTHQRKITIP